MKFLNYSSASLGSITLSSGQECCFEELPNKVPSHVFMTSQHVDLCHRLADSAGVTSDVYPVLVNFIVLRSQLAKSITALFTLCENGLVLSGGISLPSNLVDACANLPSYINKKNQSYSISLLPKRYILFRYIPRILAHMLFAVLGRQVIKSKVVIRAWIDITDRLYESELEDATLLVYPFPANFTRQLSYIGRLKKRQQSWQLAAIPYSLKDIWRLLSNLAHTDILIIQIEHAAYVKHAGQLYAAGITGMFTTDEFEPAAFAMHNSLIDKGVHTVNCCHGIAVYGPYISATRNIFCNKRQLEFYERYANVNESEVRPLPARKVSSHYDDNGETCYIFINGYWGDKPYEDAFNTRLLQEISKICLESGYEWRLKVHPDTSEKDCNKFEQLYSVSVIRKEPLPTNKNIVFVNFLSSALYDFRNFGPTIFVGDELLKPQELFGGDIEAVSKESLRDAMKLLSNPKEIQAMHKSQQILFEQWPSHK